MSGCLRRALSTGVASSLVAPGTDAWHTLLELERMACVEPGYLEAGPHLTATARRPGAAELPARP